MWEKFKTKLKALNLKTILRASVILIATGLIVFMTIANLGLRDEVNWLEWFGNVMILVGIAVIFLFLGESGGYDKLKDKINGVYQTALKKLEDMIASIQHIKIYFAQFFKWYKPQELESKKIDFLITFGVDPRKAERIVKCCTVRDLESLKNTSKDYKALNDDKVYFIRQLEEFEVVPVEEVLKGKIKLDTPAPTFFLTSQGKATDKRMLEQGKQYEKDIATNKKLNRGVKIGMFLLISIVWAFFTVKDFMSGDDASAWLNLVSRLLMAVSSYLSGFISAVITIKLEALIFDNKYNVLSMFKTAYEKHLFPCYTEEQLDEMDREEMRRKEEEAKASVITPEVIKPNEPAQIEEQPVIYQGMEEK